MSDRLRRGIAALLLGTAALVPEATLGAQTRVQVDRIPQKEVRLGMVTDLQVTVRNGGEAAEFVLPDRDDLEMVRDRRRSSVVEYNGRRVSELMVLRIAPKRDGAFALDGLAVSVGGREFALPEVVFDVVRDRRGPTVAFLEFEPRRFEAPKRIEAYEQQVVEVAYRLGVDDRYEIGQRMQAGSRRRTLDVGVAGGLLETRDEWEVLPGADSADSVYLFANGTRERAERALPLTRDGRSYRSFVYRPRVLAKKAGTYSLDPSILTFVLRTNARRGQFGQIIPGKTETLFAYGEPAELVVKPLPEPGRPEPFSGGVGKFRLLAAVDEADVKVGDTVVVRLLLRGEGNFEFVDMPELLDAPGFRQLGRSSPKRYANGVEVSYDLRVVDPGVKAVPAVTWNWFDVESDRYVEGASEPVALSVAAVEGGALEPIEGASEPELDSDVGLAGLKSLALDTPRLAFAPSEPVAWFWVALAGGAPWILALGFVCWRRQRVRRRADASVLRAQAAARRFAEAVRSGEPGDAVVAYLADRLDCEPGAVMSPDLAQRLIQRGVSRDVGALAEQVIESMAAARYGSGAGPDEAEARGVVDALEREGWR